MLLERSLSGDGRCRFLSQTPLRSTERVPSPSPFNNRGQTETDARCKKGYGRKAKVIPVQSRKIRRENPLSLIVNNEVIFFF